MSQESNIYVTKATLPPLEEYVNEISMIWKNSILTNMGELHNRLEEMLLRYLKVQNVSLFVNGHMALEMAIQAMNLEGEVITTPYTFASTTHAIVRNKLKPVFCDIGEDYTINTDMIESLITENTCAIVPVHVYGNICNIEKIDAIAKKYGLKVIYDAAHAFGVEYNGKGIGCYGDASMFSFHATKVFNSIEGGAVTFSDTALGDKLYCLKNFGIKSEEIVDGIGANGKMNEFQAAMGICNLRHIDENIQKRKKAYMFYQNGLSKVQGVLCPKEMQNVKSNYAYYPIQILPEFPITRDELYNELKKENIYARKYFYPLTSAFECYKELYNEEETPNARMVSNRVLTLPLYPDIEERTLQRICDIINRCSKEGHL